MTDYWTESTLSWLYSEHIEGSNDPLNYFDFLDAIYVAFPEWDQEEAYNATKFLFKD